MYNYCPIHKKVKVEEIEYFMTSDRAKLINPGEPCAHEGCLNHVLHPCEGCGRIAGRGYAWRLFSSHSVYTVSKGEGTRERRG